jgi:predicted DNA-binding transcriptional regulator AlpA
MAIQMSSIQRRELTVANRDSIGELFVEMNPNEIVRTKNGPKVFGLGPTQIAKKIKQGEIPAPIPLCETGRASGWTGFQINEYRRQRAERIGATVKNKGASDPPCQQKSKTAPGMCTPTRPKKLPKLVSTSKLRLAQLWRECKLGP